MIVAVSVVDLTKAFDPSAPTSRHIGTYFFKVPGAFAGGVDVSAFPLEDSALLDACVGKLMTAAEMFEVFPALYNANGARVDKNGVPVKEN